MIVSLITFVERLAMDAGGRPACYATSSDGEVMILELFISVLVMCTYADPKISDSEGIVL